MKQKNSLLFLSSIFSLVVISISFLLVSIIEEKVFLIPSPSANFSTATTIKQLPEPAILPAEPKKDWLEVKVVRVIDGDTLEIDGGQRVRYIGIDTPESAHPERVVQCFATEAYLKNRELVEGKIVRLEKDVSETDKYGRLLRYVWLDNLLVNEYLVQQGYAQSATYPPDIKYQERFLKAQRQAMEEGKGLWGRCDYFGQPQANPLPEWPQGLSGSEGNKEDCFIKGNINIQGEKIYHLPECPYYSQTFINEARGEKWFCTEDEAIQAGWRKAKNCP